MTLYEYEQKLLQEKNIRDYQDQEMIENREDHQDIQPDFQPEDQKAEQDAHMDIQQKSQENQEEQKHQQLINENNTQGPITQNYNLEEESSMILQKQDSIMHQQDFEYTSNLNEATSNMMNPQIGEINHILGPEEGIFYKFGNPIYPQDIDWTVTLSRNDFPWHEICFPPFTAKECYEKYTAIVRDPQTFLKKVLGLKEKYKKMMESQMQIMAVGINQNVQAENPAVYCRCKGAVVSELFVKCDGDQECPNGSWLHPQCTTDLCDKSKEELDAIEEWYCEDCVARIQREDNDEPEPDENEEEEDIQLDLEQDELDNQGDQQMLEEPNQEEDHEDSEQEQDEEQENEDDIDIDLNEEGQEDEDIDLMLDEEGGDQDDLQGEQQMDDENMNVDLEDHNDGQPRDNNQRHSIVISHNVFSFVSSSSSENSDIDSDGESCSSNSSENSEDSENQ